MKNRTIVQFIFLFLFGLSCSKTPGNDDLLVDPFIESVMSSTDELEVQRQIFIDSPDLYNVLHVYALEGSDYILASDYADKFLKVIKRDGTLLSKTGGQGRGPGEYALINQIECGPDGSIYILDKRLNRVHTYSLDNETGKLTLKNTVTYKHEANSHISSLYVTEFGYFGVFMSLTDYETWENIFYLYELDEEFQPVSLLLELPGNDKIPIREDSFGKMDNFLGSMTHWDLDGEWFYYMTSKKTNVYAYNLTTGEQDTLSAITLGERKNSDAQREYLKKTYDRLIESSPTVETVINETESLPYFDTLIAKNGNLILRFFDAGSDTGLLIHYHAKSDKVRHIIVPTYLLGISYSGDRLFGYKNMETGERMIVELTLDK